MTKKHINDSSNESPMAVGTGADEVGACGDPKGDERPTNTTNRTLNCIGAPSALSMASATPKFNDVGFLISNRRSLRNADHRKRTRASVEEVARSLSANFTMGFQLSQPEDDGRHISYFQGSREDLQAKLGELDLEDVLVERVVRRHLAVGLHPLVAMLAAHVRPDLDLGTGKSLRFTLRAGTQPIRGARVRVYLVNRGRNASQVDLVSDKNGEVAFDYSDSLLPAVAQIEPAGGAWSAVIQNPQDGQTYELPPLKLEGSMGWWHFMVGLQSWSRTVGEGIRIGVADTGVGPHPFLDHVIPIGAFVEGSHDSAPSATKDIGNHGTHVCGIIGARPPGGHQGYGGIAAGAELYCARVFGGATATNADVAAAVDEFSDFHEVDLVNLSLGGPPSSIEADAILHAFERGTLCVCAAGNEYGKPVLSPASLPYTAAISALGLRNQDPKGSLSACFVPEQLDKFSEAGLFLASFSNIGPELTVASPGNGIISTVPATPFEPEPYCPLDGTSMASPVAAAALAVLLSGSSQYKQLERGVAKSNFAIAAMIQAARDVGLRRLYQGSGLVRALL